MSQPLYTIGQTLLIALGIALLGAFITILVTVDAPTWLIVPVIVFPLAVVVLLLARDPAARQRRWLIRLMGTAAFLLLIKASAGISWRGRLRLTETDDIPLAGSLSFVLGGSWFENVSSLLVGFALFWLAARMLRMPLNAPQQATELLAVPLEVIASPDDAKPEVFHERIRNLLESAAHESFTLDGYDRDVGCLTGHYRSDGQEHPVFVRCDDRREPLTDSDAQGFMAFCEKRDAGPNARYLYVIPDDVAIPIRWSERFPAIRTHRETQLVDRLVYFQPYLRRLVEVYETEPLPFSNRRPPKTLSETFVMPKFRVGEQAGREPGTDSPLPSGSVTETRDNLTAYLDRWLEEPGHRQIALLADYGMGKSSFLRHYATHLARRTLHGDSTARIPILISLTGKSPRNDDVSELVSRFIGQYSLRCEYAAFELLMRRKRLVFLIDAFDEVDLVGDKGARLAHFASLWRLALPGNKLLFAGRPGYFLSRNELEQALRATRGMRRLVGQPFCEFVYLQQFETTQIKQSFARYFGHKAQIYYDEIAARPNLVELARRPAMMHIIRDSIEKISAATSDAVHYSELREGTLLELYTEHWIKREEGKEKRKLLVESSARRRFARELASWMFTKNRSHVTGAELASLYFEWFPDESERAHTRDIREGIGTDLRNCTFLKPIGQGFKFAHKSFFEYFVAAYIVASLNEGWPLTGPYLHRRWPFEIASHVTDLWLDSHAKPRGLDKETSRVLFRQITGKKPWSFLGLPLTAITGNNDPRRLNALQVLVLARTPFSWIEQHIFFPFWSTILGTTYSAECITALHLEGATLAGADLQRANLRGFDLTGTNFYGASLQGADLSHSMLARAKLDRANLNHATLDKARLDNATLEGAILYHASLRGANLNHTTLESANLYRVSLQGANLEKANLKGANLEKANLKGANLKGANLEESNLKGANLEEANLRGAYLEVADLERAKLQHADLERANLEFVNLTDANLTGANLTGASLREARLDGATLDGTNLDDTKLDAT